MFGPIGRHLMMTTLLTWRGWWEKPAWFWKPITAGSLLVAAFVGSCWPMLGGDGLYQAVFGESFFTPAPTRPPVRAPAPQPRETASIFLFTYAAISYTFWSLALVPHTLVRIGWLLVQRIRS
jgi:hypothetical protein